MRRNHGTTLNMLKSLYTSFELMPYMHTRPLSRTTDHNATMALPKDTSLTILMHATCPNQTVHQAEHALSQVQTLGTDQQQADCCQCTISVSNYTTLRSCTPVLPTVQTLHNLLLCLSSWLCIRLQNSSHSSSRKILPHTIYMAGFGEKIHAFEELRSLLTTSKVAQHI